MSGNETLGTPGEGGIRKKPSYSEVLKSTPSTRPAPINTDVARAMQAGAKATSATASSGFWSAANASLGTGLTAATPLFSPSIWSPVQQGTQSATIPHKQSWNTGTNNGLKSNTPAKQTPAPSPAVGLGLNIVNANSIPAAQSNIPANGTPYKYKQHDIANSQTRPFSRDGGVRLASTAPLVQLPFNGSGDDTSCNHAVGQPTVLGGVEATHNIATAGASTVTDNASLASTSSVLFLGLDVLRRLPAHIQIGNSDASPSERSFMSDISEHVEMKDIGKQPHNVAEEAHPKSFARTRLDESLPFAEAFPGAEAICNGINPSHYGMEYGSRVVCVKTDFVENIHWSIKTGNWVVMEKVAGRIMQLWDSLQSIKDKDAKDKDADDKDLKDKDAQNKVGPAKDKVLFVFSINGQKSYCGLAEMSGPWKPATENIEGFRIKSDGTSRTWGVIPITWFYIKNVSYNWFRHIKNPYNDQDIVNMWNGMHFPSEVAREVVELIIRLPHFTNVMCWRLDRPYDPYRPVLDASHIDPTAGYGKRINNTAGMLENVRPTGRGHGRGQNGGQGGHSTRGNALAVANWRQHQERPQQARGFNVVAPNTAPTHPQGGAKHIAASATPPNLDGHTSPGPHPGQLVPCVLNRFGNYVPVTPGGGMANSPMASDSNSLMGHTPRGTTPARGGGSIVRGSGRGGHQGSVRGGHHVARGNLNVVNSPAGGARVAPTPQAAPNHQSFAGFINPQLRHMNPNTGFEDPFAGSRNGANAQTVPGGQIAAFQRAVPTANFVPQHVATQAAVNSAPYSNLTTNTYTPAHGGGVALAPASSYRPSMVQPFPMPNEGLVHHEMAKDGVKTAAGYQIYPTPTDPVHEARDAVISPTPTNPTREAKNVMNTTDVERLNMEYLEHLHREAAIKRQMVGMQIQKAGAALPEYLTETPKSGRKED